VVGKESPYLRMLRTAVLDYKGLKASAIRWQINNKLRLTGKTATVVWVPLLTRY
jgi:hypothetical protein